MPAWTETRVAVCYAAFLLAAGLWMVLAPHYAPGSTNLLRNGEFDSASGWDASPGVVVRDGAALLGADGPGNLTITQVLDAPPGASVRVEAVASWSNVVRGPQPWQSARIELFGRAGDGPWRWDFDNTLLKATGTSEDQVHARVFKLPDRYDAFRIEAHFVDATGLFRIEALRATMLESRPFVHATCIALGLATGLVMLGGLLTLVRQRLGLALGGALLLLLFLPGVRDILRDALVSGMGVPLIAASHLFTIMEAFSHAVVVGILCVLVMQGERISTRAAWLLLPVSAWHLEALQHLLPGRQLGLVDAAVNVVAALAVITWWQRRTSAPPANPGQSPPALF